MNKKGFRLWVKKGGPKKAISQPAFLSPHSLKKYVEGDDEVSLSMLFAWDSSLQGHTYWSTRYALSFSELNGEAQQYLLNLLDLYGADHDD